MITVTVLHKKGGSGKTTLMQMLATAMLDRGGRVHMMDVDTDSQLIEWEAKSSAADWEGVDRQPWPEALTIGHAPSDVDKLYALLGDLEDKGVDLVLIDTRPGSYEDTETLCLAADVVLIPAVPVPSDFVFAEESLTWMGDIIATLEEDQPAPIYRSVLMNAPHKAIELVTAQTEEQRELAKRKVHKQDLQVFEYIQRLPMLPTPIKTSEILRRMPLSGPLTLVRDTYKKHPTKKFSANHAQAQIDVCNAVLDDVVQLVEEANAT
jgi:chromosome partitioning protein